MAKEIKTFGNPTITKNLTDDIVERSKKSNDEDYHKFIEDYRIINGVEFDRQKVKTENICKIVETSLKIGFFAFAIICGTREITGKWLPINFITKTAATNGIPKIK